MARRSSLYLGVTAALCLSFAGMVLHAAHAVKAAEPVLLRKVNVARQLRLTDLCLCTEASYTRHLGMSDLASPFQDSPASLDHFPSGALIGPPPHLIDSHVLNH